MKERGMTIKDKDMIQTRGCLQGKNVCVGVCVHEVRCNTAEGDWEAAQPKPQMLLQDLSVL